MLRMALSIFSAMNISVNVLCVAGMLFLKSVASVIPGGKSKVIPKEALANPLKKLNMTGSMPPMIFTPLLEMKQKISLNGANLRLKFQDITQTKKFF